MEYGRIYWCFQSNFCWRSVYVVQEHFSCFYNTQFENILFVIKQTCMATPIRSNRLKLLLTFNTYHEGQKIYWSTVLQLDFSAIFRYKMNTINRWYRLMIDFPTQPRKTRITLNESRICIRMELVSLFSGRNCK